MNQEEIQAEIDRIRQERATKGGRMSNAEKAQIEHLEAMLNIEEDEPVSEDESVSEEMKRIMIMNHNAGMPGPMGAVKVFRFDIVETTAEHADALCNAVNADGEPMAKETADPVNVVIEDGQRVQI